MKAKILNPYFDKNLNRLIEKDEVIEIDEDRQNELKAVGIQSELIEETIEKDEVIEKPKKGK